MSSMSVVTAMARRRSRIDIALRTETEIPSGSVVAYAGWCGVCLLALVAPYETLRPLVRFPGQSLSSVEAPLVLVVGAWALGSLVVRRAPAWRTPLTWPGAVFLAVSGVAALVAAQDRANAWHMTGRLVMAFALFLLTVSTTTTPARLRGVLYAATLAGVLVSVLVILEYLGVAAAVDGLTPFHRAVALVGTQVRASGPLQYPTIASMYLEICFALGLGLLAGVSHSGRRWETVGLVAALALMGEAVVLTFTRSGLITLAVTLAIVIGTQLRRPASRRSRLALGTVALAFGLEALSSRSAEAMRVRLTTEGQDEWFRAAVDAPATLTLRTGERLAVPVRITNAGRVTWDPDSGRPFRFSYHWLEAGTGRVVTWEGARTEFPGPVPPGASVTIAAEVLAPRDPGDFRLVWDVEHVKRLWFSTEPGVAPSETRVTVTGPIVSGPASPPPSQLPQTAVRPGRFLLWSAALRMLAAHPITGVGLDNFRLQYGAYAELPRADARMHTNNMYLELLVGTGVLGGCALLWIAGRVVRILVSLFRVSELTAASGIAAAVVAIAVHGCLDTFLGFTPTYVLIAISMGLAVVASHGGYANAHRI